MDRLTRTGLTSAIFHHFVQYLPRLEVLQLEYPMDVKTEDVTALAQGCPKLRTIGPYQVFNREVLKQLPAGVVFPHVENFIGRHMEPWHADWVGGRNPSIAAEILVFLDLLQQRLPRLRRLWVQRWFVDEAEKWCVDTRDVKVWGEDFRYGELVSHPFHGWPALELDRPSHELKLGVLGVD